MELSEMGVPSGKINGFHMEKTNRFHPEKNQPISYGKNHWKKYHLF